MCDAETYFFLTLKQFRLNSLKNDYLTSYYLDKLEEAKVLETVKGEYLIDLDVPTFKGYLS